MDGIVLINKPAGCSSYDVVRKLKRFSGIKKIGHGGTLDPAACGVLVILMGEACKISRIFLSSPKEYFGTVRLGISSSTGDRDGELEEEGPSDFSREDIKKTVESFRGQYLHKVPEYSSKKFRGKPFYSIKRGGNKPPERNQVSEIHEIEFKEYSPPDVLFRAKVSSGTYVRTLAEDIARKLGTCGYLEKLERISVDGFGIDTCVVPEPETWKEGFVPLDIALQRFPYVVVDGNASKKIDYGVSFTPLNVLKVNSPEKKEGLFPVFSPEMKLKALAERTAAGGYALKRVFNFES